MTKTLYIYADETGKMGFESIFVVAVVCVGGNDRIPMANALERIERETEKGSRKWAHTHPTNRQAYFRKVAQLRPIRPFYHRLYRSGQEYLRQTADTVVATVTLLALPPETNLVIDIDGLNPEERQQVRRLISSHRLPNRRAIRGSRDESTPFLRLADAAAGFIRHCRRDESYATELWKDIGRHFVEV